MHEHATLSFPPTATSPFPTLAKLYKDMYTSPPTTLFEDDLVSNNSPLTHVTLHKSISNSNGLFVIQYTPAGTFKSR